MRSATEWGPIPRLRANENKALDAATGVKVCHFTFCGNGYKLMPASPDSEIPDG